MQGLFDVLGFLAVFYAVYSLIVGRVSTWSNYSSGIFTYERTEHPVRFYFNVAVYFLLGVMFFVISLRC